MRKNILFIILFYFLLVNCSSNKNEVQPANSILGSWELIGYENTSNGDILVPPDSAKPIIISFMQSEFEGHTGRNSSFGDYTTKSTELIIPDLFGTEVGESEWGNKFYDFLASSFDSSKSIYRMNYSVKADTLKINNGQTR